MKNDAIEDYSPPDLLVTIDKLTLALPMDALPAKLRKPIAHNLEEAVASRGGKKLGSFKKGFKQRYSVPIVEKDDQSENALIEYQPMQPERAKYALRIEFNPNKIGPAGCATIRTILKEMFGEHFVLLSSAMTIPATDPCVDIPGLSCADVVFHTTGKQIHSAFGKISGKDSEAETLLFGSPTSDHQVRAYDKRREVLATNARLDKKSRLKITDLTKAAETVKPRMRLEVSLKNLDLHPSQLHTLKNPFQSVQMYNLPRLSESPKSDFDRLFIDSVRLHGLSLALERVHHEPTRRRLKRMVAKYRIDWWNPDQLGPQIVDAVRRLHILPDAAFELKSDTPVEQKKAMRIGSLSTTRKLSTTPAHPILSR